jgi:polysaccharide export outer membrane protein
MESRQLFRTGLSLLGLVFMISGCAPGNISNRDIALKPLSIEKDMTLDASSEVSVFKSQYRIATGDVIEIKYPFRPEFDDQYTVRTDGRISLPFIGSILAAGKTPEEVQKYVNNLYLNWMAEAPDGDKNKEYRIQANDLIEIKFSYQPEIDELVTVRPDGRISLPLVGTFLVEGKTPEQLNKELVKAYDEHLRQPNLVVIIREFSENNFYLNGVKTRAKVKGLEDIVVVVRNETPMQVFVGGEVQLPGFFPYTGPVTALQAIIMAGGNRDTGEMRQVAIIRKSTNGENPKLMLRNLNPQISSNDDNNMPVTLAALGDVTLQPNDIVIVPKSNIAKVNNYLDQYLYTLIPALRNSSFGFIYNLNPVDKFESVNTTGQ